MIVNNNRENINKLKNIIFKTISPLINNDFILLDIPNHRNIGDSLIWKGEKEFFKDLEYKCLGEFNRYTFRKEVINDVNTVILLHGGGNFGDLYLSSQLFKRMIIESFPKNRIVLLPQTVDYLNEGNKDLDFNIFNKHNDLYFLLRDKESFDIVENRLFEKGKLFLCPDMAFYLDYDKFVVNKNNPLKTLLLSRTDGEAVKEDISNVVKEDEFDISDWPTYNYRNSFLNKINNYYEVLEGKICNYLKYLPGGTKLFDSAYGFKKKGSMELHISEGIKFLNVYDKVYTTRLHGLILCVLLNKEIVIVDNAHKKCLRFYSCWLKEFNNITLR
ncbi:polysaccharide pyruvyl transferase family protein [Myroides odoratimimus]|uniref:polysaccharide pyruvyl transferase family protein n=1 Tax=Myroides odoratimimus TaxID=76832 RepID=UPI002576433D|nr:polysaccharide pyruvyl transferase family protein [Myroides odoratimimus]MDM1066144.1 polysaccharide pyruvyl transferase family protein [Myroides odoratimimus]MEC4076561.1 polysaccharide pyruvyl transferase family protein [Myroides odoratimimus]